MNRKDFLNQLYEHSEGRVELRALPSRVCAFFDIGDHSSIDKFASEYAGQNLYFGIATRDGIGGRKENIIDIPTVWCDVDYKTTPREVLAEKYKQLPFAPTATVFSGGGVHFYFILKEPAAPDEIERIESINRRLAAYLSGDLNACDAARIFRLPDTFNHKYDPARLCQVKQLLEARFNLSDFDFLPELALPRTKDIPTTSDRWLEETMLTPCAEGSRNATAIRLAGYWINRVSGGDVYLILQLWNRGNDPPLSVKELRSVVHSATRYEKQDLIFKENNNGVLTQTVKAKLSFEQSERGSA